MLPVGKRRQGLQLTKVDRVAAMLSRGQEQQRFLEEKLLEKFPDHARATVKVFEKTKDLRPPEREKKMQEHRRQSDQRPPASISTAQR